MSKLVCSFTYKHFCLLYTCFNTINYFTLLMNHSTKFFENLVHITDVTLKLTKKKRSIYYHRPYQCCHFTLATLDELGAEDGKPEQWLGPRNSEKVNITTSYHRQYRFALGMTNRSGNGCSARVALCLHPTYTHSLMTLHGCQMEPLTPRKIT